MDDEAFIRWLQMGQVVLIGEQTELDPRQPERGFELDEAFSVLRANYDPCKAPHWRFCMYCPWERCRRP